VSATVLFMSMSLDGFSPVLFGLEDEFGVLDVVRVDQDTVKVIIEQAAREGPARRAVWSPAR
jgi:hypothetical protein